MFASLVQRRAWVAARGCQVRKGGNPVAESGSYAGRRRGSRCAPVWQVTSRRDAQRPEQGDDCGGEAQPLRGAGGLRAHNNGDAITPGGYRPREGARSAGMHPPYHDFVCSTRLFSQLTL
ncbi:hypothetical protein MPRS_22430 [Mycobacterium paraseoulense]|nr:hypothetical protein MPRS_22430 [Mycobacterium paraseoulense]